MIPEGACLRAWSKTRGVPRWNAAKKAQLGNSPQAFMHLALVGAAVNIERARNRTLGAKGLPARTAAATARTTQGGRLRRVQTPRAEPETARLLAA
jgi:hypothetical protein